MRTLMDITRSIATLALAWSVQAAHAVAPAMPENVICGSGHLFTGKIVFVESRDCKLRSPGWCSPRDAMVVHVLIDRVLATVPLPAYLDARFSVEAGQTLPMYVFAFPLGANRYPALLREGEVPVPMTNEWLKDRLVARTLMFMAGRQPSGLPDGPTLLIGSTLPIESLSWVQEVLRSSCNLPKPIR